MRFADQAHAVALAADALAADASVRQLLLPLAPLLDRADVTDIAVNRPAEVHLDTPGGWISLNAPQLTEQVLLSLATAVATYTSQTIGREHPIVSATLPGGQRIQIVVPPAVEPGTVSITIRRPAPSIKSLDEYAAEGLFEHTAHARTDSGDALTHEFARLLREGQHPQFWTLAVQQRQTIAIVGDTGSGKTTFLKALAQLIAVNERLVTIEDTRELVLARHRNAVHLLYSKGGQGAAQVSPADLIASAMRMKPDRAILAELRGSEAFDFLKLLTTGHEGSMTSFHAASADVAIERFALMAREHPEAAVYAQQDLQRLLSMTVDIVAHLQVQPVLDSAGRITAKRRRMSQIRLLRQESTP